MDSVDTCYLIDLVNQRKTTAEISNHLQALYPRKQGFSERSVYRFLMQNGITRRQILVDDNVDAVVSDAAENLGPQAGRRYIKGYIEGTGGPTIAERRIGRSLKRIDPENHTQRHKGATKQLNPKPYRADYFGHRLHLDQNEKLARYGVTHVASIDGFSGYVPAISVMPVKNNITIYDRIFRKLALEHGLWDQIVVDQGREFHLTLSAQNAVSQYRTNPEREPYRVVKSTQNNRIERFWVEVNSRVNYPIKNTLIELEDAGRLNMLDELHKYCCSAVSCAVAEAGISKLVIARNHHPVQNGTVYTWVLDRGVPEVLKQQAYHPGIIDPNLVLSAESAANSYRQNGGCLTDPYDFGHDSLAGNYQRQRDRADILAHCPYSVEEIYSFTVNNDNGAFKNYLMTFLSASS